MGKYTDPLRDFWSVDTLEAAMHQRVSIPAQEDWWNDQRQAESLREFFAGVPLTAGQRILDYGCGVGRVARALARHGMRVVAVDVSPKMVEFTRDYCSGLEVETLLCDGYGCGKVARESVDGAVSCFCYQHMPSLDVVESVTRDIFRVLRPAGWFHLHSVDHGADVEIERVDFTGCRQKLITLLNVADRVGFAIQRVQYPAYPDDSGQYIVTFVKPTDG